MLGIYNPGLLEMAYFSPFPLLTMNVCVCACFEANGQVFAFLQFSKDLSSIDCLSKGFDSEVESLVGLDKDPHF